MSYIIFDGVKIGNLGSGESGYEVDVFPSLIDSAPPRDFGIIEPMGRNGSILLDNKRYPNIQQVYNIIVRSSVESTVADLRDFLLSRTGYCRLSDSWHTSEYYKAYVSEPIEPTFDKARGTAKFEVVFNRMPQRFLVSGETPIPLSFSSGNWDYAFNNPSRFAARPLFAFVLSTTGSGSTGADRVNSSMDCIMQLATIPSYQTGSVHSDYWYYINLNTNDQNVKLNTKALTGHIICFDFERRSVYLPKVITPNANTTLEDLEVIDTNVMNDWVYVTKYPNRASQCPVPSGTETFDFPEIAGKGKYKTVLDIHWAGQYTTWSVCYPRWWTI